MKSGKLASQKEPAIIGDVVMKNSGVFEYMNIGTITEGIVEFARQSKWAFPPNVRSLVGRKYKVPVCFVYRTNAQGKIDLVREYLDVQSLLTQLA